MHADLTFADAQRDMRHAYFGGAAGMFASALVWLAAGCVAWYDSPRNGVLALCIGGTLIHPLGVLFARGLGRPGSHSKGNPLGNLALEGTIWMLVGVALAFVLSYWRIELFFPAMLCVIGGRYLTFATVYGMRIYWACGVALAMAGWLLAANSAFMAAGGFAGAAIEFVFAVAIAIAERKVSRSAARAANAAAN